MIESKGQFLLNIQDFLNSFGDLNEILNSYQVESISELQRKIIDKELPEHPSYEDYLDCLGLYKKISEFKLKILDDLNGVELESYK